MTISHDEGTAGPLSEVSARGRVLSVNVGKPAPSTWRGATVVSSIVKQPVDGRVEVRGVNVVGDEQADLAVHGGPRKAVYAYPSEHYLWWTTTYGVPPAAWGYVGENLTLIDVSEQDIAFGDLVSIGTVRLMVTEPRGPCYKLAMRIGADDAPAQMLQTGRTGFYLAIVKEGALGAGDEVICHRGDIEPRVSIATLCAAFARPSEVEAERLLELLALPGLDAEWRLHFQHELDRRQRAPISRPARHEVKITAVDAIAHDVVRLEFTVPTPNEPYKSGQFLPLLVSDGASEHVRCYSLLDAPEAGRWRIAIRRSREPGETFSVSRWLHANARPGMALGTRAPAGAFTLPNDDYPGAALIAGGIGVTPMLALGQSLARNEQRFALFFGVRDETELLFVSELRELAAADACMGVHVFYPGARVDHDALSRVDSAFVQLEAIKRGAAPEWTFYVCGPTVMQHAIVDGLHRWGVDPNRIHVEYFGQEPVSQLDAPPQEVIFDRCSRVVLWSDPAMSLLDLAAEHGFTIPYSCRSGSCGTCAVRVLGGSVGYVRSPSAPLAPDECLTCIAYPKEALVLDV